MSDNAPVNASEDGYSKLINEIISNNNKLDNALMASASKIEQYEKHFNKAQSTLQSFNNEMAKTGGNGAIGELSIEDALRSKNESVKLNRIYNPSQAMPQYNYDEYFKGASAGTTEASTGLFKGLMDLKSGIIPMLAVLKALDTGFKEASKAGNEYNKLLAEIEQSYIGFTDANVSSTTKNLQALSVSEANLKSAKGEFFGGFADMNNQLKTSFNNFTAGLLDIIPHYTEEASDNISYSSEILKFAAQTLEDAGVTTKEAAEALLSSYANNISSMGFNNFSATNLASLPIGSLSGYLAQITGGKYEDIANSLFKSITTGSTASGAYGIQLSDEYLYGWLNKEKGMNVKEGQLSDRWETAYRSEYAMWQLNMMKEMGQSTLTKLNTEFYNLGEQLANTTSELAGFDSILSLNSKILGEPEVNGQGKVSNDLSISSDLPGTIEEYIEMLGGLSELKGEDINFIIRHYGADDWFRFVATIEDDKLRQKLIDMSNIEIKNILKTGTAEEVAKLKAELGDVYDLLLKIAGIDPAVLDLAKDNQGNTGRNVPPVPIILDHTKADIQGMTKEQADAYIRNSGSGSAMLQYAKRGFDPNWAQDYANARNGNYKITSSDGSLEKIMGQLANGGTTINNNFKIDSVYGNNDLETTVTRALNKAQKTNNSVTNIMGSPSRR